MRQQRSNSPGWEWLTDRRLPGYSDALLRVRVMRPSFVSLRMRPTAPPIWLGIAVAASLIVIETVAVVCLNRLTGQPFGTWYIVDVMVVSTVWGFGLFAMTSVGTAIAYTYFRNWPHTHVGPDGLGCWRSNAVLLLVALLANTIAAVARTGERFSDLSSDLVATAGPQRLIRLNRACERYRLFPARLASICCEPCEGEIGKTNAVTGAAVRQHEIHAGGDGLNRRKHHGIPNRQPVRQRGCGQLR